MTYKEFADKYKVVLPNLDESVDCTKDIKMLILSNLSDIQLLVHANVGENKLVYLKIDTLKEFVSDAFSVMKFISRDNQNGAGFQGDVITDGLSGFRG